MASRMSEDTLPAIVDKAAGEKLTTGRTGIRWDKDVKKIWEEIGGDHEEALAIERSGGTRTKGHDRKEGTASASRQGEK